LMTFFAMPSCASSPIIILKIPMKELHAKKIFMMRNNYNNNKIGI
jgi:hypothetical protein